MTSETSVLHKQNDTRRENSKAKYFWVITEPVLPNCRQVLRFVCLCDYIQKVSSPTRGFPYYTLSAVSFSCLLTIVLSRGFFVFFWFLNREHLGLPLNTADFPLHKVRQHSSPFSKNGISDSANPNCLWWFSPGCSWCQTRAGEECVLPCQWAGCTPDRNTFDSKIWIRKPNVPPPDCITSA